MKEHRGNKLVRSPSVGGKIARAQYTMKYARARTRVCVCTDAEAREFAKNMLNRVIGFFFDSYYTSAAPKRLVSALLSRVLLLLPLPPPPPAAGQLFTPCFSLFSCKNPAEAIKSQPTAVDPP